MYILEESNSNWLGVAFESKHAHHKSEKKNEDNLRVNNETYTSFFAFSELQRINLRILVTKSEVATL